VSVLKLTIWTGGHHIQLSVLDYCPTGAFWSFVDDFLPEMSSAATFQQILPCPMMSLSRHGLEKIVSLKAVSQPHFPITGYFSDTMARSDIQCSGS
jgi:hypothetical protein